MNYLIVVKNTGNVSLKFSALKDGGCEGILPSSTSELAAGKEESFTCSHTLSSAGTYNNEASIEGNEGTGTKTSNKVSVKIPPKAAYTIEKQQRLSGENAYNKNELSGKYGQKVEYKIFVKNTGNIPLTFGALKDSGCENISPSGTTEVGVGKEQTFTCEHTLTGDRRLHQRSLDRRQRRHRRQDLQQSHRHRQIRTELHDRKAPARSAPNRSTSETRNAANGQTVEYEILVKNTGNVPLTFSNFVDEHCDAGTLAGGPSGPVKAGETAIYTCSHVVTTTTSRTDRSATKHRSPATKAPAPRHRTRSK